MGEHGVRGGGPVTLAISVLGPLSVDRSGAPVELGGAKLRLLLGVLIAHRRSPLTPDQMCDALWPQEPPRSATATLQSYLSRLRRVLMAEATVELHESRYELVTPPGAVDADRFEQAIVDVSDALPAESVKSTLGQALSWWRGPAFGDLAENSWIRPEAVRLDELRLSATERWIEARLAAGEDLELVGDLERLVAVHPLREVFWRQLMLALYRSGRQAEALRRATELARMRRNELGLDPSPEARALERQMLADDPSLRAVPRRASSSGVVVDVPTRLVGRDDDLARLSALLVGERLVTLTGPGGVGKTRLARRLGADRSASGGTATMVELTVVSDEETVAATVARALDVQRQDGTGDAGLTEFLADRDDWLLLDNCEHVIGAVASLVARLTAACPRLRIVATSREPLGVPGEVVYTVAPLLVADESDDADLAASPAVQLFCERAAAARSGFEPTPESLPALARLCRRLDGLPLAIELAAVRARSLGLEAMIERLDHRFSLFDAGSRHADERHQNLHNMVAWSYDLLSSNEQRLFDRLSVFSGSFDLPAVDSVCTVDGDPADLLFTLVDRSMVQVVDLDEPRYRLLETLREFGRDRLARDGAAERVGRRHLEWFTDLVERGGDGLNGPDERWWSDRIDRDFDNVRAAYSFAMQAGDIDSALRIVRAVTEFSFRRMRYEVTSWADAATTLPGADGHPSFPAARATVAYGHFVRGELDEAFAVGHEAMASAKRLGVDSDGLAERALGNAYFYRGDHAEALYWIDQMLESSASVGSSGTARPWSVHAIGGRDQCRRRGTWCRSGRRGTSGGGHVPITDRDRPGGVRPRGGARVVGAGRGPRRARRGRRARRRSGQPLVRVVRPHRGVLDRGPQQPASCRAARLPERDRDVVPGRRLGQPVAVDPPRDGHPAADRTARGRRRRARRAGDRRCGLGDAVRTSRRRPARRRHRGGAPRARRRAIRRRHGAGRGDG